MLERIDGLGDGVVAVEAKGKVDSSDYENVLDPAVADALANHDAIRFLYVLGSDFQGYTGGAMWQDLKVGVDHWTKWERIAIVTDHAGYADMVHAFAWLFPGTVKVFGLDAYDDAASWISS